MKHPFIILFSFIFISLMIACQSTGTRPEQTAVIDETLKEAPDSVLRHVVLFKFKESADPVAIARAEAAFVALPGKIPEILDFEWGLNNSPEGLNKGFTHCYFLTFASEEDRAIYLPHPDHQAFGEVLGEVLEDVLVVDYWLNTN